jgi:peroxin-2
MMRGNEITIERFPGAYGRHSCFIFFFFFFLIYFSFVFLFAVHQEKRSPMRLLVLFTVWRGIRSGTGRTIKVELRRYMAEWANDIVESRSKMALLLEQQQKLPDAVLKQFPVPVVPRVFQLDSQTIDEETFELVRTQLYSVFSFGPLLPFRLKFQEELHLLLRAVMYKFSVWDHHQSVGDRMQNLVYRSELAAKELGVTTLHVLPSTTPSLAQKLFHALLVVIVPYLAKKLEERASNEDWLMMPPHSWQHRTARTIHLLSTVVQGLSLVNIFVFLAGGTFRSLTDRLLQMRLVRGNLRTEPRVYVELLSSNIRWENTLIFLGKLSSVLRMSRAWRGLQRVTEVVQNNITTSAVTAGAGGAGGLCAVCMELPTMPRLSNCGHTYCYYCLRVRLQQAATNEEVFSCLRCGSAVTQMRE